MSDAHKVWRSGIPESRPKCGEFPGEDILVFTRVAPEKRYERELQVRAVIHFRRSGIRWAIERRKLEDYGSVVQRDTFVDLRREFLVSTLAAALKLNRTPITKRSAAGHEGLREHVRRRLGSLTRSCLAFFFVWCGCGAADSKF
jgi:hypothetical protein